MQRRKLTLAKAIDQWAETELAMQGLKELREEAAKVLLANAEKSGRRTFKGRIAVIDTGGQLVLNQAKAVEFLQARGQNLRDFQKRAKVGLSLRLLK